MTLAASLTTSLARLLLLPGDLACTAIGLEGDDKRELVRMLVNSLVWIVIGMVVAVVVT
ncbi:MAG TPA: hypothetical protein VE224_11275 [Pseudolabrys sp.]|jgi:hypothetical protein|nr:hypothetical protein [Pseudolabrys sp.]